MILVFGTRLRRRVVDVGTFVCPFCAAEQRYERVRSRGWAHAFWIPLVPLGTERESVQCTTCHGEWSPAPGAVGGAPTPQP